MADMIEPIAGEPEAPDGGSFQCEVEFIDNDRNVIHYETYTIDDTYNGFPSWLLNKSFIYRDKRCGNWTHFIGKESLAKPLSEAINQDLRSLLWYNSTKGVYKVSLICTPPIASPMLTYEGLKVLWSQIALEDYPNNETLIAALNAVDETKADKNHTHTIEDVKGLEEGTNVQPDWNQNNEAAPDYVKNRTHYVAKAYEDIYWDGNTENVESLDLSPAGFDRPFYKISNQILTKEQLTDSKVIVFKDGETQIDNDTKFGSFYGIIYLSYSTMWHPPGYDDVYWEDFGYGDIYVVDNAAIEVITSLGFPAPSAGLYISQRGAFPYELTLVAPETIKTLDEKFLPKSFIESAGQSDWKQNDETAGNHIKNRPFYITDPKYNIQWDGVVGDKFNLDLSLLGNSGWYLVKVSDNVITSEELIGGSLALLGNSHGDEIFEESLDLNTYPGAIAIYGGTAVIVHDSDSTNAALGLPSGYITNGTYFSYSPPAEHAAYTSSLVGPTEIVKIDYKFIPDVIVYDGGVRRETNMFDPKNDIVIYQDAVRYSNQNYSEKSKQQARTNIDVYSKSEVDTKIANSSGGITEDQVQSMIAEAIGIAIGSAY